MAMTRWTSDELSRIGAADELEIAALRRDGTFRTPVSVWVVRVGDRLYVRSWRGDAGAWFRAARASRRGRIRAGGAERDVRFVDAGDDVDDAVDGAYRAKYGHYGERYVGPMVGPQARTTTLALVPHDGEPGS